MKTESDSQNVEQPHGSRSLERVVRAAGGDELDRAIACVERMRIQSRRAGEIARLGTKLARCVFADLHDALDVEKSRARIAAEANPYPDDDDTQQP